MNKKVLFFTGTRADYGLLSPLIHRFYKDSNYQTEILATGTHLAEAHGTTSKEIEKDGFKVKWPVDIQIKTQNEAEVTHSMAVGVVEFGKVLSVARPDLVFILGDRYEALIFAIVCQLYKIPVAHIHGGELTEGAMDDAFRHSITKLSYFHFAAAQVYADRIIRLGENPAQVFNVGALGVENALNLIFKSREELEKDLQIHFKSNTLLVTFHPATIESGPALEQVGELLSAIEKLISYYQQDVLCVFTMPNADPGSEAVVESINKFIKSHAQNCVSFKSLGRENYLSLMVQADVVVGNSSSGIIEAPALKTPTVNIGSRQTGREKSSSVFDCECNENKIYETVIKAIKLKKQKAFTEMNSLFGDGKTSDKIKRLVDQLSIPKEIRKRFYEQTK